MFTADSQLIVNVPVNPEYSYLIAASYKTKYGKLRPSENVGELGEFEHMMDRVGCQIRNNIYFKDKTPSQVKKVSSSLKCAEECFDDDVKCTDAWSYQIATKICHFYNNLADSDIAKLQPNSQIQQTDRTIGWASGLKSCNANLGKISKSCSDTYIMHVILFSQIWRAGGVPGWRVALSSRMAKTAR